MRAAIVFTIVHGAGAGGVYRVNSPCTLICGRGEDSNLRIHDPYVSNRHVLLEVSPPACRLQDLGSDGAEIVTPPKVNGRHVRQCPVRDGDVIELGSTQLRVSLEFLPESEPRCAACGAALDADTCAGDAANLLCASLAAGRIPHPPQPGRIEGIRCPLCGVDLTPQANSDGRASEFGERVSYLCAACLPQGEAPAREFAGPYELRKLLGEDGMGQVYQAYHRPTARLVALKRIQDIQDSAAARRFEREVRVLRLLTHPRIVRFIDSGLDQSGAPYLVTEFLPGGNLEGYLLRKGSLSPAAAVPLIRQVLEGLQYLHAWQVIHRDIKPENILLHAPVDDGVPWPMLADFGVSRCYELAGGTRLTKPGVRLGTLMFMPPEQVIDAAGVRETADTYSVGVTLYYLLTGRYSFEFPSPADVRAFQEQGAAFRDAEQAVRVIRRLPRARHPVRIILGDEPIPVLARDPALPASLAAVVDKAVRKDPARRFQSAAEFRSALQSVTT